MPVLSGLPAQAAGLALPLCSASFFPGQSLDPALPGDQDSLWWGCPGWRPARAPRARERYWGYQEHALEILRPREAEYPEARVMGAGLELAVAVATLLHASFLTKDERPES